MLKKISYELINKLAFDILREKKGLIYNLNTFETKTYVYGYNIQGIRLVSDLEKFSETLGSLHTVLKEEIFRKEI